MQAPVDRAHLDKLAADIAELERFAERLRPPPPVMQASVYGLTVYWEARDAVLAARDHRHFVSQAFTSWLDYTSPAPLGATGQTP